jgi:esterase/lipase superfamily enzyme
MQSVHELIESPELGRKVHVWRYGHFGPPLVVFPSAAGFAHEWQQQGMIDVLAPFIEAGRLKVYCPESNVAEAWTRKENPPEWRLERHHAYERFVTDTLVPAVRADLRQPDARLWTAGCSLGATYAANMALKRPDIFSWALCLSGRYALGHFMEGHASLDLYLNSPLAYVPGLHGAALDRVRAQTSISLVCGRGKWEEGCIEETIALGDVLEEKGIPHVTDIWGSDVSHDWAWWRRQLAHHLAGRLI